MLADKMTKENSHWLLLLISLVLIFSVYGCSNETEDFIQGHWFRGDLHFVDEWYFDRGRFEHVVSLTVRNPILQTGRFRVLEMQEDSLIIELFDMPLSFGDERRDMKISLDWENDSIRIMGQDYYRLP